MRHWRVTSVRLTSCELDVREGEEEGGRRGGRGREGGERGGEGWEGKGREREGDEGWEKVSDNVVGLLQ